MGLNALRLIPASAGPVPARRNYFWPPPNSYRPKDLCRQNFPFFFLTGI
jgi:hypothetical protein